MQISSIRLTDTHIITGPTQELTATASQVVESIALQSRIETLALAKRTATPLAAIPEKAPESDLHVVGEQTEDATRIAVPKVGRPAAQQPLHSGHGLDERALRTSRTSRPAVSPGGELARDETAPPPDSGGLARAGPRRYRSVKPRKSRLCCGAFTCTTRVLVRLTRQPEVLFELPFEPGDHPWSHVPRQHHKVVGVPHQSRLRKLGGAVGPVEGAVEVVEVNVGEQRRNHPALRRPVPRVRRAPTPVLILVHDRTPQPQTNQPQHRAVGNPPFELPHSRTWSMVSK